MSKIGILTSGGDAPGMNACIRACVRSAKHYGIEPVGIKRGYHGLINGDFTPMNSNSVSNIIHRGGTILGSARSVEFRSKKGRKQAYNQLKKAGINKMVVIGGDGTFTGATIFHEEYPDVSIVGAPGTIDNDLYGTDFSIGYDTAINTAMQAIDKIKDTASSHDRMFIIEVMGRHAGFIAIRTGLAVGAEAVLAPEYKTDVNQIVEIIRARNLKKNSSSIIVVAEGDEIGGAYALADQISKRMPSLENRVTILGHIQRGGSPTCMERVLASKIGLGCIKALMDGEKDKMVGVINHKIHLTPFKEAINKQQELNPIFEDLIQILS
jgi:6-phosphofructokinase 1